jgi:uncharacterized repeat protein (TIGR03803 family)
MSAQALGRRASTFTLTFAVIAAALSFTPQAHADRYKVVYTFQDGSDGSGPESNLLPDGAGGFYGTTYAGGGATTCVYDAGCGTVYHISPTKSGAWTETVLYRFGGSPDAGGPLGALVKDSAGNLYGSTSGGGTLNCGTVFELSPPAVGNAWTDTVLHSFPCGTSDGSQPEGGLTWGPGGVLYGITEYGGYYDLDCYEVGCGTVFQLLPPAQAGGSWTESVIHEFSPEEVSAGGGVNLGLVVRDGILYGATGEGGTYYDGSVLELSQQVGSWTYQDIFSFAEFEAPGNGYYPYAGVVLDGAGNIYGTAGSGGSGYGVVYELTEPGLALNVLYSFEGSPNDGSDSKASLAFDTAGNLYGTTAYGGSEAGQLCRTSGCGVVFELSNSSGAWSETVLHTFVGGTDGAYPFTPVYVHNGIVFGTAHNGGAKSAGIVFEIIP